MSGRIRGRAAAGITGGDAMAFIPILVAHVEY
jgi:hypothetical protein